MQRTDLTSAFGKRNGDVFTVQRRSEKIDGSRPRIIERIGIHDDSLGLVGLGERVQRNQDRLILGRLKLEGKVDSTPISELEILGRLKIIPFFVSGSDLLETRKAVQIVARVSGLSFGPALDFRIRAVLEPLVGIGDLNAVIHIDNGMLGSSGNFCFIGPTHAEPQYDPTRQQNLNELHSLGCNPGFVSPLSKTTVTDPVRIRR